MLRKHVSWKCLLTRQVKRGESTNLLSLYTCPVLAARCVSVSEGESRDVRATGRLGATWPADIYLDKQKNIEILHITNTNLEYSEHLLITNIENLLITNTGISRLI